ncbi:MAG: hypothetical protein ACE5EO_03060 [Candidatus Krumholzibacteriia bacterium]
MATAEDRRGPLARSGKLALFGLLLFLSLVFFGLVRNNTFWSSGDYLYLEQAIETGRSLRHVFTSAPFQPFQPLVRLIFFGEYSFFGLAAWKYYLFNIFIHALNAYFVFFLVFTLLRDRAIAFLSSLLFVFAVGNYGKAVMVVAGIGDLLITLLTLLTLLLYFKNELQKGGRLASLWFVASLLCFTLSLMTKATSFSILGCMFAFHVFFRKELDKGVFNRNLTVVAVVAFVAFVVKLSLLPGAAAQRDFTLAGFTFFRNFGSYLVRMVFPIHGSSLVTHAGPLVQVIYKVATEIRLVTFLIVVSYTVFGFIFGNRTIRFFIAWTYITLLPFCFFKFPNDWLNIRHLYLVSVGFIMILSSVTVLASRLLYERAWRRFLPYGLPLLFVFLSQFIIYHLDKKYELTAKSPEIENLRASFLQKYPGEFGAEERGQRR